MRTILIGLAERLWVSQRCHWRAWHLEASFETEPHYPWMYACVLVRWTHRSQGCIRTSDSVQLVPLPTEMTHYHPWIGILVLLSALTTPVWYHGSNLDHTHGKACCATPCGLSPSSVLWGLVEPLALWGSLDRNSREFSPCRHLRARILLHRVFFFSPQKQRMKVPVVCHTEGCWSMTFPLSPLQ